MRSDIDTLAPRVKLAQFKKDSHLALLLQGAIYLVRARRAFKQAGEPLTTAATSLALRAVSRAMRANHRRGAR